MQCFSTCVSWHTSVSRKIIRCAFGIFAETLQNFKSKCVACHRSPNSLLNSLFYHSTHSLWGGHNVTVSWWPLILCLLGVGRRTGSSLGLHVAMSAYATRTLLLSWIWFALAVFLLLDGWSHMRCPVSMWHLPRGTAGICRAAVYWYWGLVHSAPSFTYHETSLATL